MKEIGQLLVPNHPAFPTVLDFKRRNLKGEDLDQFVNGLKKNTHVERIEFNLKQLNCSEILKIHQSAINLYHQY